MDTNRSTWLLPHPPHNAKEFVLNGRKFQVITQVVGTITLAFLAVYGLLALIENSAVAWAQGAEVADVPSSAPSLESSEVSMSVPLVMNYQGDVKDAEGNALDGSYNMTFRIYSDVVAGAALWEEQQQNVMVRAGHFSVLLGNTTPLPETLFDESDRFIGVTVDPYEEMVPRQRFGSVPYTMQAFHATSADNADTVGGLQPSDLANTIHSHSSLNAPDGSPQDALMVDAEGNVVIGTTTLSSTLQLNGNFIVSGAISSEQNKPAFFVNVFDDDCGWSHPYLGCPDGYFRAGKWHVGGGTPCDSTIEGVGYENGNIDRGWMGLCVAE